MTEMSLGYRFGPAQYRRNYTADGKSEWVLILNRDGFEKKALVDADTLCYRMRRVVKLTPTLAAHSGEVSVAVEEYLLFERSPDRSPEGLAIFRESGFG